LSAVPFGTSNVPRVDLSWPHCKRPCLGQNIAFHITEIMMTRHPVRTFLVIPVVQAKLTGPCELISFTWRNLPEPLHQNLNFPGDLLLQCKGLVDSSPGSNRILPGYCRSLFRLRRALELPPCGGVINRLPVSNKLLRRAIC